MRNERKASTAVWEFAVLAVQEGEEYGLAAALAVAHYTHVVGLPVGKVAGRYVAQFVRAHPEVWGRRSSVGAALKLWKEDV